MTTNAHAPLLIEYFADRECTVKTGFQMNTDKTDKRLRAALSVVENWLNTGQISDGEVLQFYARVSRVKPTEAPSIGSFTRLDGEVVEAEAPPADATPFT